MPRHDYTPRQALDILLDRLRTKCPELAQRIHVAINAGKDVQVAESSRGGRGRKPKKRYYRKTEPCTDQDALAVALGVLEAHLVENRKLVLSAHEEFRHVGLVVHGGSGAQPQVERQPGLLPGLATAPAEANGTVVGRGETKRIVIESEPEAIQDKKQLPDIPLVTDDEESLVELRRLIGEIRTLTDFTEAPDGNTR